MSRERVGGIKKSVAFQIFAEVFSMSMTPVLNSILFDSWDLLNPQTFPAAGKRAVRTLLFPIFIFLVVVVLYCCCCCCCCCCCYLWSAQCRVGDISSVPAVGSRQGGVGVLQVPGVKRLQCWPGSHWLTATHCPTVRAVWQLGLSAGRAGDLGSRTAS